MDENRNPHTTDSENQNKDNFKITFSGNPSALFMAIVKLVVIGIILYVALSHISSIWGAVDKVYQILKPLVMGSILALVLNTPMVALENLITKISHKLKLTPNKKIISPVAILLTFVFLLLIVYVVGDTVIPQIVESFKAIFQQIKDNIPEYMALLDELEEMGFNTDPVSEWLSNIDINGLINKLTENAQNIINTVISSASSIISGTFNVITSVVFTIYLLANKEKLGCQVKKLMYAYLKKSFVDQSVRLGSMITKTFSNFISGQCLEVVILGTLMFVAMTIFRFPYALTISAILTITALVPYIGAFVGGAFGCLLILIDDPLKSLLFLVMFIVIQQLENHLIYPKVVGGSVGLPAIWTFAAVIIGGGVWGVLGMVLFIPVFSVAYTLLRENVRIRLKHKNITVDSPDDSGGGHENSYTVKIYDKIAALVKKMYDFIRKKISEIKAKINNKNN
ncbi:MAG: AI-2E family transporter [Ruminococcaceae bacterium]|nr:AI-2E family transporter [Oscillospiraceae bacterium]